MNNCVIDNNDQGVYVYGSGQTKTLFSYNTIRDNSPDGGAFAASSTFSYNTIKDNEYLGSNEVGGGIKVDNAGIDHNIISGNTSNSSSAGSGKSRTL